MALYVVTENGREFIWHVSDSNHSLSRANIKTIVEVQADGHELEYIYKAFSNIPRVEHRRVVSWHGDFAKFIVANLLP